MDTYAILDMRGLVQRSLHSGTDRDAIKDSITGRPINTPGHALDKLLVDYLLPILDELRAKQIIAVWDGGNLYRRMLYPKYKENRRQREESPEMKAALSESIKNAKLLLLYLGAQQVIVDDVEGDDVIAWLVNALPSTLVYTVDGDLIQLNSDKCSVFVGREFQDTLKDDDVEVPARWVCLYKSLVGDTSDNYPGVPGFGKKSWVALAEEHGDEGLQMLQDWVASARFNDFLTLVRNNPGVDKRLEKIANHTKEWLESWRLARLHPDQVGWKVNKPVRDRVSGEIISKGESGFQTPKWSTGLPRADKLIALLASVGCRHLIERLAPHMPNRPAVLGRRLLGDNLDDAVRELQEAFAESPFIALDWETSAPVNENFIKASNGREYVDMLGSSLTGAGFTFGKRLEHTFYIPIDHADSDNVPVDFIRRLVDAVPEGVPLVIQNCLPGDVEVLTPLGWKRIDEATTEEQIMQWDPDTGNLSFTPVLGKIVKKASSLFKWDSSFHECSYTGDHRMYLKRHKDTRWKVYSASDASHAHYNDLYIPVAGTYLPIPAHEVTMSPEEARLMEAIRADGSFPCRSKQVKFRFSKNRKVGRLKNLLDSIGVEYSVVTYTTESKDVTGITLLDCAIVRRIKELLGESKEYGLWVLNLTIEAREAILDEIMFWDGGRHPRSSSNHVHTISRSTVEALQLMAHTTGRRFSVSWSDNQRGSAKAKPLARVCIAPKNKVKLSVKPDEIHGDFDVYCFSVPSGAFMVRSHGKVHITGNCYFENVIFKNHFGYHLPEFHDTKVMASHQDEQSSNGLKDLSLRILGYKQLRYSDVIEPGKAMKDYSADYILQYGADDPLVTAHIYEFLKLQLMLEGTWDFVRENEFCPIYHLSNAYLDGLNVDWEELARQHEEDISIRDTSIERLRMLLKTYQTPELIEQGVQNLLAVEMEVINALRDENVRTGAMTAEEADEDRNKAITAAMGSLYNRIEYKDISKVERPYKFALTPTQFNKVAGALGLPILDKATKAGWQAWLERAMVVALPRDGLRIVELVSDCIGTIASASKVSCPVRANLVAKCRQIMWDKVLTEEQKYEYVGSELSLSSPPQQLALLYGMLALPIRIRSFEPSGVREKLGLEGGPQANEDAILTAMALDAEEGTWKREALECLMAAKKADTRCKIFYVAYPLWKHPKTGLVHPQLNSCGTESRRMSGSSPNLMQAPKRGDGVKFRRCMLPAREHNLVGSIDWAGEELRVGAGLSLDIEMLSCYIDSGVLSTLPDWMLEKLGPTYLKRFRNSVLRDIHSLTASGMAKLTYEEFERIRHDEHHPDKDRLKKIRGEAKSVNFLSQYGGGPAKLARKLISKVEVAEEYLAAKKALYHGYESWRADMISNLNRQGYLSTLYGTRRHLYNKLLTTDNGLKGYLERSALNFLIQGVCADYLKNVLTVLWKQQTFQRHGAKFLAPIHDEIVFTFDSSVASSLILEVHSVMVRGIPGLPCPLWAEPSVGPNFGVQYEIGPHPTPELIEAAVEKALTHNSQ